VRRLIPILAAVALLAAGCGSEGTTKAEPETVVGSVKTETTETTVAKGDAAAGKQVFEAQGCGSCHTFKPAGSSGNVGPDLDEALKGKDAAFIQQSIVDPNAVVASGFQPGIMPQTYGSQLSDKQLADLVAFLQTQ
jgi:mono/diheme cytochrome c family protein